MRCRSALLALATLLAWPAPNVLADEAPAAPRISLAGWAQINTIPYSGDSVDQLDPTTGELLADTDSCSTCHPDAAAQWSQSAHSFASFGNPIYRANVELLRQTLGEEASRHCGGCHDGTSAFAIDADCSPCHKAE